MKNGISSSGDDGSTLVLSTTAKMVAQHNTFVNPQFTPAERSEVRDLLTLVQQYNDKYAHGARLANSKRPKQLAKDKIELTITTLSKNPRILIVKTFNESDGTFSVQASCKRTQEEFERHNADYYQTLENLSATLSKQAVTDSADKSSLPDQIAAITFAAKERHEQLKENHQVTVTPNQSQKP